MTADVNEFANTDNDKLNDDGQTELHMKKKTKKKPKKKPKKKNKYSYSKQQTKSVVYSNYPENEVDNNGLSFPSASLLLESAKDEYTKERERLNGLDNKSSFFMSAVILIATVFIPLIPFNKFFDFVREAECLELCVFLIACIVLGIAFILLGESFKILYNAYRIKGYSRFNIANVDDATLLSKEANVVEAALCKNYRKCVEDNIKINDDKADAIASGIKMGTIGFLLIFLATVILVIVVR